MDLSSYFNIFLILLILLILLIVLEHFYFFVLEMFLWKNPRTMKLFGIKNKELAEATKPLAANLGLYNAFIAAGLLLSTIMFITAPDDRSYIFYPLIIFFLICIAIAGIYGAYSIRKIRIFYVQAVPALFTLIMLCILLLILRFLLQH